MSIPFDVEPDDVAAYSVWLHDSRSGVFQEAIAQDSLEGVVFMEFKEDSVRFRFDPFTGCNVNKFRLDGVNPISGLIIKRLAYYDGARVKYFSEACELLRLSSIPPSVYKNSKKGDYTFVSKGYLPWVPNPKEFLVDIKFYCTSDSSGTYVKTVTFELTPEVYDLWFQCALRIKQVPFSSYIDDFL